MLRKVVAVKMVQFLFVSILFAGGAFAQAPAENPNAELDVWRVAMAETQRINAENAANYAADRAEWRAAMNEANRPLTKKEKFVKVALYVADKAVDNINIRIGVRGELGRAGIPNLPTAFAAVNGGIAENGAAIAANGRAIAASEEAILASARANLGRILKANSDTMSEVERVGRGVAANGRGISLANSGIAKANAGIGSANMGIAANERRLNDIQQNVDVIKKRSEPLCPLLFGANCKN